MHAAVRHLIKARNDRTQACGIPMGHTDQPGGPGRNTPRFLVCRDLPMRRLGVHLPAKDVHAYLHLWNVIGHLLGVRDELLVATSPTPPR